METRKAKTTLFTIDFDLIEFPAVINYLPLEPYHLVQETNAFRATSFRQIFCVLELKLQLMGGWQTVSKGHYLNSEHFQDLMGIGQSIIDMK